MSYIGFDFPPCDITEVQTFTLDFQSILVPGEVIVSTLWEVYLQSGEDTNPSTHIISVPTFTDTTTSQQIDWTSGQNAYGNVYTLRCSITTNAGNIYEQFADCKMAPVYTAPLSPISLAENIIYKLQFSAAPHNINSVSISAGPDIPATGLIGTPTISDEGTAITWIIYWPWWTITIEFLLIYIVYTNGDKETLTVPIEIIQPPNIEPPDPHNVCANVYSVSPWDRINIA